MTFLDSDEELRRRIIFKQEIHPEGTARFKCVVPLPTGKSIQDPDNCIILCTPRVFPPMLEDVPSKSSQFSAGMCIGEVTNNQITVWFRRTDEIEWSTPPRLELSFLIVEPN